jgi:DNA-binding transcriptional MocR family regulator
MLSPGGRCRILIKVASVVELLELFNLSIDKRSDKPLYEQIRQQIEELAHSGLLQAGTRLPTVRQLSESLGISKNTVALAYEELSAKKVIETRHGAGSFICTEQQPMASVGSISGQLPLPALAEADNMPWESMQLPGNYVRMFPPKHYEEMISFTQAGPDALLFPYGSIKQIATNMLWQPRDALFTMGRPFGYRPLAEHLEMEMALDGVQMGEEKNGIIVTAGFQRAASLLMDIILQPGKKVALENPCYANVLNLLIAKRISCVPVPVDACGMQTDYLERELARGEIGVIIATPAFHNPTGVCLSQERREHLLQLCRKYSVPVIEDDWSRNLRYEGTYTSPVKAMDEGGYVIHLGTFSKCFLPGLRIGWITCPSRLMRSLCGAILGTERGNNMFTQALLFDLIQKGHFARHLRKINKEYKRRRDVMCDALLQHLPEGCRFVVPQGGLSVWLELPPHLLSLPLLQLSRQAGVDFWPAACMTCDRQDAPALRLAFAQRSCTEIQTGMEILCGVITDCLRNPQLLEGLGGAGY